MWQAHFPALMLMWQAHFPALTLMWQAHYPALMLMWQAQYPALMIMWQAHFPALMLMWQGHFPVLFFPASLNAHDHVPPCPMFPFPYESGYRLISLPRAQNLTKSFYASACFISFYGH